MEESHKKYMKFDFSQSEEWQAFYDSLYPKPTYKKIEKFKRKWYKRIIDPDFDVTYNMGNSNVY